MTGMACKCFVLISNWFLTPTRTSTPLIDRHRRVVAHLIGCPADDPTWGSVNDEASRALEYTHGKLVFSTKDKVHRQERFPALTYGISHGGGQTKPGMLCHSQENADILRGLVENQAFIRISGFVNGKLLPLPPPPSFTTLL